MVALRRPSPGSITSPFGKRTPGRVGSTYHRGIDFGWGNGWTIFAAAAGRVIWTRSTGGFGNLVKIDHGGGNQTWYAHTSRYLVSEGAQVSAGQAIAVIGNTGIGTGAHLHFEYRINGTPVDPMPYFTTTASGTTTTPIEEEEDMMKIIAPYGLPDKGVIAPGFGYAFPDSGQFAHFLNVWEMGSADSVPVTTVGGPSWSAEQNREVFYLLINIHRQGSSYPFQTGTATVDTTALAEALAPLIAGGATAEQIAAKVDAILKDDFAAVTDAIPTEFTITVK